MYIKTITLYTLLKKTITLYMLKKSNNSIYVYTKKNMLCIYKQELVMYINVMNIVVYTLNEHCIIYIE